MDIFSQVQGYFWQGIIAQQRQAMPLDHMWIVVMDGLSNRAGIRHRIKKPLHFPVLGSNRPKSIIQRL